MMDKQGWARRAERVRRLYLPPSGLPVFCTACEVNAATGVCNGCLRSLSEIRGWADLNEEGKHVVWARIQKRLFALRDAESAARRAGLPRRAWPPVELLSEPMALPEPEPLVAPEAEAQGGSEALAEGAEPSAMADAAAGSETEAAPTGDEVMKTVAAADTAAHGTTTSDVAKNGATANEAAGRAELAPGARTAVDAAVSGPVVNAPALTDADEVQAAVLPADAAKTGEAEIRLRPLV